MRRRDLWRLAPVLLLGAATAPQLVPDVSQRDIEIQYSFTGADLLLFGAIVYPDGNRPEKPADIVVVLKGPEQSITMREKQKVAGIWVNADRASFRSAPSFYAMASSRP
ncbi:MAG: TIGR02186 family protein, partial [Alphaproteobacteria bacterium]|nr:TIGR02186 family protein [Alphaproteobacteria bacterium]MBU1463271.1 TIGR02186 family protein [Alphaproteobacteria bacterium]